MSEYYVCGILYSSELCHHGIRGQKWGKRRWQNLDGSLTQAGKVRYETSSSNSSIWDGSNNGESLSTEAFSQAGREYAGRSLSSMVTSSSSGSKSSTVESGKNSVYKMLGSFTIMKDTNGVTRSAIKEALEKKRKSENEKAKEKTESKKTEQDKAESENTKDATKNAKPKKESSKKKAKKKAPSKRNADSKKEASKSDSLQSNESKAMKISSSQTKVVDLKLAGTSVSKKNVDDFLKRYKLST